jgi:hypothetical protein
MWQRLYSPVVWRHGLLTLPLLEVGNFNIKLVSSFMRFISGRIMTNVTLLHSERAFAACQIASGQTSGLTTMASPTICGREQVQQLLVNAENHYNEIIEEIDSDRLDVKDREVFHDCKDEFLEYRNVIITYLRKHQGDVRVIAKILRGHLLSNERKREALASVFYRAHGGFEGKTQFEAMHNELSASLVRVVEVLRQLQLLERCIDQPKYKGIFRPAMVSISGLMVSLLGLASLVIPGLQILAPVMVVEGASFAYMGGGAMLSALGFYKLRRVKRHRTVNEELIQRLKVLARNLLHDVSTAHTASLQHEEHFNERVAEANACEYTAFDPTDLDFFLRFADSFEALWEAVITYPKPPAAYNPIYAQRLHSTEATVGYVPVQTIAIVGPSVGAQGHPPSYYDGSLVAVC